MQKAKKEIKPKGREHELTQTQRAQKQLLRAEVYAAGDCLCHYVVTYTLGALQKAIDPPFVYMLVYFMQVLMGGRDVDATHEFSVQPGRKLC